MGFFIVVISVFLSLPSWANECELQQPVTVHLVGEVHGTQTSQDLQTVLIPGAMNSKLVLGLEIDSGTLGTTLNPQFLNSLIAMEDSSSKGFGLVLWAWRVVTWTKIKYEVGFSPSFENPDIADSISSFTYFLGNYPTLKQAVTQANAVLAPQAESNKDLNSILDKTKLIIAKPLTIQETETLLPADSVESLKNLSLFFKEVLRAYVSIVKGEPALTEQITDIGGGVYLDAVIALLDHKEFNKSDKNFGSIIYNYDRLYRSMESALLFNWRSDRMAKNIFKHLCAREKAGLVNLPFVALAGGGHLSYIEKVLKELALGKITTTFSVPPSSHSDFELLYKSLQ